MRFFLLLFILLSNLCGYAQDSELAKMVGYVKNEKGEPVPSARISVKNKTYSTSSDKEGYYILLVTPGSYEIIVSALGYTSHEESILLHKSDNKPLQVKLKSSDVNLIEQVVVEAKSALREVRETPFNVVALDARAFHNTTSDLAHVLNKASGVRIREMGGVGSDVSISLNGFTGGHVKVFMDGLPMQGFGSAFQLNNIPANLAERIEVYKGVVPIEFGSDALGGVINIVTNQSTNTSLDASLSYGSFNTQRMNINFNTTTKKGFSFQLNTVYNYSDNDYPVQARVLDLTTNLLPLETQEVRRFNDHYKNYSVVARVGMVGQSWADRIFLGLTAGKMDRGIQNANNLVSVFGERSANSNTLQPTFSYDKRNLFVEGLSIRVTANYNYNTNTNIDTASRIYNWLGESRPQRGQGEAQGTNTMTQFVNRNGSSNANVAYRFNEKHAVSVNDVYTHFVRSPSRSLIDEELDPLDLIRRVSVKNVAGISYRYNHSKIWNTHVFGKHYLTIATGPQDTSTVNTGTAYVERTERFPALGYGIASTYFFGRDIQVKASIEKALRLPTDQELFGDEIFELGNLTLKPEKSYNFNLGFVVNKELNSDNTVYIDVNMYYRNIQDYIMRNIEQRFGTAFNTNHGKARNIGVDAEVRYYYQDKVMFGMTVTRMDLRDKEKYRSATGTALSGTYNGRLPNVPYFFGSVDAAYYFQEIAGKGNALNIGYTMNFVDEFFLRPEAFGAENKATLPRQLYHDFITTLMLKNGRYNISFEANNFTNIRLFDNFAMEKPGRVFNLKLRYFFMKRLG